jgi:hypothetical protein
MDAVLTVESDEAVRLAGELAALTGKSVSDAVTAALAVQIEHERRRLAADARTHELVEIGERCAANLRPPFHSSDHADLYGDDGLPR